MFNGCSRLTATPVVQWVKAYSGNVFSYMFQNCSRLKEAKV